MLCIHVGACCVARNTLNHSCEPSCPTVGWHAAIGRWIPHLGAARREVLCGCQIKAEKTAGGGDNSVVLIGALFHKILTGLESQPS